MKEMERLVDKYPNGYEGLEGQASTGAAVKSSPTPELTQKKASGDVHVGVEATKAN